MADSVTRSATNSSVRGGGNTQFQQIIIDGRNVTLPNSANPATARPACSNSPAATLSIGGQIEAVGTIVGGLEVEHANTAQSQIYRNGCPTPKSQQNICELASRYKLVLDGPGATQLNQGKMKSCMALPADKVQTLSKNCSQKQLAITIEDVSSDIITAEYEQCLKASLPKLQAAQKQKTAR